MKRLPSVLVILALATLATGARGEVYNLKIVTDASPDYSDLQSMIHSVAANWATPREKVWAMFYWNHIARRYHNVDLSVPVRTPWLASASAAVVGSYSHILLDSLFHPDIEPLQPWSGSNPLFGIISPMMLQIGCILLGLIGLAWFFGREIKMREGSKANDRD